MNVKAQEQRDLIRSLENTTYELSQDTARLRAHPYRSSVIAFGVLCPPGVAMAYGLTLINCAI
jgi:hypothetical protein